MASNPNLTTALWRGMAKRCPRCGEGALFERWLSVRSPCAACGARTLENEGDSWAFVVLADRVFVLLLIVLVYFRVAPESTAGMVALFAVITAFFLLTTPHRFGLCLALAWALRRRFGSNRD